MSALSYASPPGSAIHARPTTPEEIDAHPDRDRIWATIVELRDYLGVDTDLDAFWGEDA